MNMETDDKLKSMFSAGYNPLPPSSTEDFMRNLESRLDVVDLVRAEMRDRRHSSAVAMAVAMAVGIVLGVAGTLAITSMSPAQIATVFNIGVLAPGYIQMATVSTAWGGLSLAAALLTYPLVMFLMGRRATRTTL